MLVDVAYAKRNHEMIAQIDTNLKTVNDPQDQAERSQTTTESTLPTLCCTNLIGHLSVISPGSAGSGSGRGSSARRESWHTPSAAIAAHYERHQHYHYIVYDLPNRFELKCQLQLAEGGARGGRQNCNTRSGQALEESQRSDTQFGLGGAASSIAGFHFRLNWQHFGAASIPIPFQLFD